MRKRSRQHGKKIYFSDIEPSTRKKRSLFQNYACLTDNFQVVHCFLGRKKLFVILVLTLKAKVLSTKNTCTIHQTVTPLLAANAGQTCVENMKHFIPNVPEYNIKQHEYNIKIETSLEEQNSITLLQSITLKQYNIKVISTV